MSSGYKRIMRAYRYLFYRIYLWQLESFGEINVPMFTALLGNTFLVYFHIMTLVVWYQIIVGPFRFEDSYAILVGLGVFSINYLVLVHGRTTGAMIAEFSSEPSSQRKRRTIWCWIYVGITLAAFFASVLILNPGKAR